MGNRMCEPVLENKSKKSIIVLGGNKLHRGFSDIKEKLGVDEVIVIDWNKEPAYKGDRHIQCDIKAYDLIANMDIDWENIRFVYTSADIAVRTQIELHKSLGLLAPAQEAIENALVKGRSTECWRAAGILNKYSQVVEGSGELDDLRGERRLIIKPNCSSGSRNITILDANEQSTENIENAIQLARSGSLDKRAIVEEFCDGTEYTVDMLGDNFGNVSVFGISKKYHTPYNTRNRVAVKLHYNPSDVSDDEQQRIAEFGQMAYKEIGLSNSFGHLEVIVMEDGRIVPVEIGARSSGYIATHLLDLINDRCYLKAYEDVIRGEKVENGITYNRNKSSMYFFYDVKPGVSKKKTNLCEYLKGNIISVAFDRTNLVENRNISMLNGDHERIGLEILAGKRENLTIEEVRRAEKEFERDFMGEKNDGIL